MTTLLDKLADRMKAVVGAAVIALVSIAQWLVTSPDTAPAIESVIPAQFAQFVPLVLGIAGTVVGYLAIYFKSNATPTVSAETVEPPTETTINRVLGDSAR